jgi:iron complex outermembrane receptor protein
LRGTYATGFRAPGLYENGNSASAGFTSYIDPVRCPLRICRRTAVRARSCRITGGNPNIQPEKSDQLDGGLMWEPVPAFNVDARLLEHRDRRPDHRRRPQLVIDNPGAFPTAVVIRDPATRCPGFRTRARSCR